jgi:hypothetical protein
MIQQCRTMSQDVFFAMLPFVSKSPSLMKLARSRSMNGREDGEQVMKTYEWRDGAFMYRVNDQETTDDPPALEFKGVAGDQFYDARKGPLWPFSREMIRLNERIIYVLESVVLYEGTVIVYVGPSIQDAMKAGAQRTEYTDYWNMQEWRDGKCEKFHQVEIKWEPETND